MMLFRTKIFTFVMFLAMLQMPYTTAINLVNDLPDAQSEIIKQNTPQENSLETNAMQEEFEKMILEQLANKVVENRNALDATLQYLAEVINNSNLTINKELSREYVRYLRFVVSEIAKQSFEVPDLLMIIQVTEFIDVIIELTSEAVTSNLTKFSPFNPEQVFQCLQKKDLANIEAFIKQLEKQTESIKSLDKKVKDVGLSRFNKVVRNAVQFSKDYRLFPRLGYASLIGLFGAYIVARIPKEIAQKLYLGKLKSYIGDAPVVNAATGELQRYPNIIKDGKYESDQNDPYNYTWYADIEHFLEHKTGLISSKFTPLVGISTLGSLLAKDVLNPFWKGITDTSSAILDVMQGKKIKTTQLMGEQEPRYTFDDIIGQDQAKEVLMRVVNYIRDHEKFDRAGLTPEAGYVLAGPPGTGKTLLAEACAGEIKRNNPDADFKFFSFSAALAIEVGIENILYLAKEKAPCLIFIDEFDLLNLTRGINDQKLGALLTALSGTMNEHLNHDNKKQVILLVATNRPQQLDDALKRHGRFGKIVQVNEPTMHDRMIFIKSQLENRAITMSDAFIQQLAHETEGCVMESLRTMIKAALQKAKTRGSAVNEKDFEQALDEEIRNIAPANTSYGTQEKELIAIHQIGHALASLLLNPAEQLVKVTLRPVAAKIKEEPVWDRFYKEPQELTEYGKMFTAHYDSSSLFKSHEELRKQCMIHIAGHLAEELVLGSTGYTYHKHDQNKALAIAKYVIFKGLNDKDLPKEVRKEYESKAFAWYESCTAETKTLLAEHTQTIKILAQKLIEEETLTADTIKTILHNSSSSIIKA